MSRPAWIAAAIVGITVAYGYYDFIDGSFRRPGRAAFRPPAFLAKDAARSIGASWSETAIRGADGTELRAWLFRPALDTGKAVLLMHETGGTRLNVLTHVHWLLRNGFTCLTPDSRGHGSSGGKLVTAGLLEGPDVVRWTRYLRDEAGARTVYGLGHSLGASSLIHGLALGAGLRAVVADSTGADFPTRYSLLAERMSLPVAATRPLLWMFIEPAMWNARLRYALDLEEISPIAHIRQARAPVLLIHGSRDWFIPIGQAWRLREANPRMAQLWEVPGAGHVEAARRWPGEYRRRVLSWFETN